MKFHVNAAGEAGKCKATKGNCPFGGEAEHFTSAEAAREHYEKSMQTVTTRKLSKAKPVLPQNETFEAPELYEYQKEYDAGWAAFHREEDPEKKEAIRLQNSKLSEAWGRSGNLILSRYLRALGSGYTGPLGEALQTGAVTRESQLGTGDNALNMTVKGVSGLPVKTQKAFYSLPVSYAKAFVSTKHNYTLPTAHLKKLIEIAETVHSNNPEFVPYPMRVATRVERSHGGGRYGDVSIPQMQNASPESYSLLIEYANQKYGDQADRFLQSVSSTSRNHPKVTDFARAEREFDKRLASE